MKAERVPHPAFDLDNEDDMIISVTATASEWMDLLEYEAWSMQKQIKAHLRNQGLNI
jgi:hypothetical protein